VNPDLQFFASADKPVRRLDLNLAAAGFNSHIFLDCQTPDRRGKPSWFDLPAKPLSMPTI